MLRESTTTHGLSAVTADWQRLYEENSTALLRYLAKLAGDREVASDLMQETFVRSIRANPNFEDDVAARAFLFRTATNLARNEHRRRRALAFLPFSGREYAPDSGFDPTADQVRATLRSIPFDQAAALLLHYQAGFHRREIAEAHGVSEETVKSRLARGRKNFIAGYRRRERGLRR